MGQISVEVLNVLPSKVLMDFVEKLTEPLLKVIYENLQRTGKWQDSVLTMYQFFKIEGRSCYQGNYGSVNVT